MRFAWARAFAALLVLAAAACSSASRSNETEASGTASSAEPGASTRVSPVPAASTAASADRIFAPRPNTPIAATAPELAGALERVTNAVRGSVEAWTADGASSWPPPEALVLQTLYQERIYRALASRPAFAHRVFEALPRSLRVEAAAIVRANGDIFAQANPVRPSYRIRTRAPEPAETLRRYFEEGERRFGVPWQVLAAVNYVETKFGRVVSNSSAGAQGPMQFLPSTWAAYGLGGDIHDAHDAILGAANYLHANGAPTNVRGALYHYNPVRDYVDAVATYAAAIRRDPRLFYAMYCWQVYILTTHGDERITGPGL